MRDGVAPPDAVSVDEVSFHYSGVRALNGVTFGVGKGRFEALLGSNGAGKSTLAKILAGMLRPSNGRLLVDGEVLVGRAEGKSLADRGIALVPERRRLFGQLTTEENLILAAYGAGASRRETKRRLDNVLLRMPLSIQNGRARATATFSGGEQQMIAIGRAIMADPQTIIIDEPSLGLAPIMIDRVYELLTEMNGNGVSILTIEQIATHALAFAQKLTVIEQGRVVHSGPVTDAAAHEVLQLGYQGHVD